MGNNNFWECINSPVALILITATISGLLVPYLTSQWQNHKQQLEFQNNMQEEINEAVIDIVIKRQIVLLGHSKTITQEKFDEAFMNWEINKNIISSKLDLYYGDEKINKQWKKLEVDVDSFYADPYGKIKTHEEFLRRKENILSQKNELIKNINSKKPKI